MKSVDRLRARIRSTYVICKDDFGFLLAFGPKGNGVADKNGNRVFLVIMM
jgi:hypothetical protein